MPQQSETFSGSAALPSGDWAPAPLSEQRAQSVRALTPAGEPIRPFLNPWRAVVHCWRLRSLVSELTRRELAARYRGSFLGALWSLLAPNLMLSAYTFVFSIIFKGRWGNHDQGHGQFALTLFAGLVPYNVFAEVVGSAPALILGNASYVKRVVFPLEVLPLVRVLSATVQGLVSAAVLLLGVAVSGGLSPVAVLTPVAWVPLLLLALAAAYALAALGVFVRDTAQAVTVLLPIIFFLTPIVYPLEAVPAGFQALLWLNPLTLVVEDCRRTAVFGLPPRWTWWSVSVFASAALALGSFVCFMKAKRGFHDAL